MKKRKMSIHGLGANTRLEPRKNGKLRYLHIYHNMTLELYPIRHYGYLLRICVQRNNTVIHQFSDGVFICTHMHLLIKYAYIFCLLIW